MTITQINANTAKEWLDQQNAILLDVREPVEYATEHIPGALLCPVDSVGCHALPETDATIIIHCQKGMRGEQACQKLTADSDALHVYNIEGGIEAWRRAGLPVEGSGSGRMPLARQVQLTIGLSVLLFSVLGYAIDPAFSLGAAFFGAGLTNAGLTGWCGLAKLMAKMPWN